MKDFFMWAFIVAITFVAGYKYGEHELGRNVQKLRR